MSIAPDTKAPASGANTSTFAGLWRGAFNRFTVAPAAGLRPWDEPRVTRWFVFAAAVLLFLRKPWALMTPQLWAEDGPIHLADADEWGLSAVFIPYRGYLHLLPRVTAWFAQQVADVAYWPFIYSFVAYAVTIVMLLRLTSPRLALPGKPWLILCFVVVAHTGEVWFNLSKLQWISSFFLLQQILMSRPVTRTQRAVDLMIVAVAGLTGPFVVIYLPFFIWHWWRDGDREDLAVLLVAAGCAVLHLFCIQASTLVLAAQSLPLNLERMMAVIGARLVVWPLLGPSVAESLPPLALGGIGAAFIVLLLRWSLRPHPDRRIKGYVALTFVLMTLVCVWRIRPDTWASPDLVNGDVYFYIPRILLGWLLIWEFNALPRAVAVAARAIAVVAVVAQIPSFVLPTPTDFNWAHYSVAIRRGEPASIPILPEGFVFDYLGRPRGTKVTTSVTPIPELPSGAGRLTNISVRTDLSPNEPVFTIGMVVGGVGTAGTKPLMIRAVGPSLIPLGVANALPDPEVVIKNGTQELASNDQWGTGDTPALRQAFAQAGAFGLVSDESRDAALRFNPEIKGTTSYAVEVRGHGGTGPVLAEIYDMTPAPEFTRTTPRLVNFSVLKHMGVEDVLTVGFFVGGLKAQRVLIRAVGPTLGTGFGVANPADDPKIHLLDGNRAHVAQNNDWGRGRVLVSTFQKVAAFPLPPNSRDAALVATLNPGSYNAQVSLNGGRAGMILVEVYEVP